MYARTRTRWLCTVLSLWTPRESGYVRATAFIISCPSRPPEPDQLELSAARAHAWRRSSRWRQLPRHQRAPPCYRLTPPRVVFLAFVNYVNKSAENGSLIERFIFGSFFFPFLFSSRLDFSSSSLFYYVTKSLGPQCRVYLSSSILYFISTSLRET